jgi:hypothetical protein
MKYVQSLLKEPSECEEFLLEENDDHREEFEKID